MRFIEHYSVIYGFPTGILGSLSLMSFVLGPLTSFTTGPNFWDATLASYGLICTQLRITCGSS